MLILMTTNMTETKNIKISLDNPNSRHQFGWTGQDIIWNQVECKLQVLISDKENNNWTPIQNAIYLLFLVAKKQL